MEFKYFNRDEFRCSHTGTNDIQDTFIYQLDLLRESCGFPFVITSGYRSITHPVEEIKPIPGQHTLGIAADVKITNSLQRHLFLKEALGMGFTGIGVAKDFIHVDTRDSIPVLWCY